jgi:hypothetical protein
MRAILLTMLLALGIGLVGTSNSPAVPASGIGLATAAQDLSTTTPVHCRPYRHSHRVHRRYSRLVWFTHRC